MTCGKKKSPKKSTAKPKKRAVNVKPVKKSTKKSGY